MPRDISFTCKKRHHPDGFHLSTSSPKRLLSSSEADSSIESANDSMIRPEWTLDSVRGSIYNPASAVISSDCSTIMWVGRSTIAKNAVSSKPPSFSFTHSQAPSDAASYNTEASKSVRGLPFKASCKDNWMHRSAASKCEGTADDSEYSEVTYSQTCVAMRESEGVSHSGKATHVISRREKSSLNPKWGMHEAWVKDAFGSDSMLQEKRLESDSSLHSTSQRKGFTFFSMACESGSSCATGDCSMEEIRPEQGLSHMYGSFYKESLLASPNVHTRAEGLVGQRAQERREGFIARPHFNTEVDLHSSFLHKGKTEELSPSYVLSSGRLSLEEVDLHSSFLHKGKTKELSPSYVLSSGRPSLEEEARRGRRAPTIDRDFEEYFSSLMLE